MTDSGDGGAKGLPSPVSDKSPEATGPAGSEAQLDVEVDARVSIQTPAA